MGFSALRFPEVRLSYRSEFSAACVARLRLKDFAEEFVRCISSNTLHFRSGTELRPSPPSSSRLGLA